MRKAYSPEEYHKREKLIADAALRLLKKKNFSNITMRELAKECGMANGTLFNYYPSKELLFRTLLYDYYCDYFDSEIERIRTYEFHDFKDYKEFRLQGVKLMLEDRHSLIDLLSVHHNVFIVSDSVDALEDKRILWSNKMIESGRLIHEKMPEISEYEAVRFYYFLHALLVGYRNLFQMPGMTQPPLIVSGSQEEIMLSVTRYLDGQQKSL